MNLDIINEVYAQDPQKAVIRIENALSSFRDAFGSEADAVFSAPGRTEIGGNHTDHQKGRVLAAAIDRDAIAAVRKNGTDKVNICSEGYGPYSFDIGGIRSFSRPETSSRALVMGVISYLSDKGYKAEGFDCYIRSDVKSGSGLSSSAAFEVLIGTVISGLFNDGKIDGKTKAFAGQYAENVFFGKPSGLMDQMACSLGGLVAIDFGPEEPEITKLSKDLSDIGLTLCITDTGADHSDLTREYALVPEEMHRVAKLLGHDFLKDVTTDDIIGNIERLRAGAGDRAVLRAIHFVNETVRAGEEARALGSGDRDGFLRLVRSSGDSSYKYLQNVMVPSRPELQSIPTALCMSELFLDPEKEAARVHGGGFAGTIQAFVQKKRAPEYKARMDNIFGQGSCEILNVRRQGGIRLL